ncbi:MAG: hypothetical protein ACI870_000101 [Crocinitomicaceae bacterium]|jgi:hypothetical protein
MSRKNKSQKRKIIKKNGKEELFIPQKLCDSMVMVGASDELAQQVCSIVDESIESGVSTDKIFNTTRKYLKNFDPRISALYALERGLGALGPSGFIFEQYVAALFGEMNYKVQTNVYAEGEGVTHEIDVWAEKGNVVYVIEAKYRNEYHSKTHINQVMYADARMEDIKRRAEKKGDTREFYMWVVTNTRFTDNAINYVAYRDMQLMGGDYPKYINLKKIVSDKKLYPVTILPSITKKALRVLSEKGIILVKSLYGLSAKKLEFQCGLNPVLAKKLEKEIAELIT